MALVQTLGEWLKQSQQELAAVCSTPGIDARLCLSHVLQVSNSYLYSYPERILTLAELTQLNDLLTKRLQGHPLAYLFGYWHFFGLTLKVSPSTLIPRPDTEILVEYVLGLALPNKAKVLDLGTGTGAIALALAQQRQQWQVTAVDYISDAVALAETNRVALAITNCRMLQSNWFDALQGEQFDLIVSNPPYIDPQDPHLIALKHEPLTALTAANNGMADIVQIVTQAQSHLNAGGWLWLEHGYNQAEAVQHLLQQAGFTSVESKRDYGNNWRISGGQKRG
ncbi:peptide chain release factor N(5)-glutamine methyltransferase [Rheinheimera baltica]|uniref:Release factor glutamine methyltransferase n=1 Tax=Rheinheimera baltica TaxID=67576 RepID=A0ABT9HZ63_9GAMM|nr:peptide chain release factor N(5)-glutamine methyltransferase [Rheinheimera baltica]MDP5136422.1 peptide chain release factor N(5)-glutamine methyltransferase [Rheinheimera baltica]MDP5143880.1 peptide chain release factor N(5)-glutamine methyltransferase [Rheinheimera baltica]